MVDGCFGRCNEGAALPRLGRRTTGLLIVLAVLALMLAWWDGGERRVRPIEQDIAVPEGVL